MMYKAKIAVCSDIRTKHSTQSERHVEFFWKLNLLVRKETARLQKVKAKQIVRCKWVVLATLGNKGIHWRIIFLLNLNELIGCIPA
jgi:hypothetical protein